MAERKSSRFMCFLVPTEKRIYVEPLIFRFIRHRNHIINPEIGTPHVFTDGHGAYNHVGKPTDESDILDPLRPKLFEQFRVVHQKEFVSSEGHHTNRVEGANFSQVKSKNSGGGRGGPTSPYEQPFVWDYSMWKSNYALPHTQKYKSHQVGRQLTMVHLVDIGTFYPADPTYTKFRRDWESPWYRPQPFCTHPYGGPWFQKKKK
eukprot:861300_1